MKKKKILNKKLLKKLIKITDPFLMINKVIVSKQGISGLGYKILKKKEWFFKSHFLNDPMMPGTLQTEAMLQTIVAIMSINKKKNEKNPLIVKSNVNFYRKISGNGKITINAKIVKNNSGAIEAKSELFFKNKKTASGSFRFLEVNKFKVS